MLSNGLLIRWSLVCLYVHLATRCPHWAGRRFPFGNLFLITYFIGNKMIPEFHLPSTLMWAHVRGAGVARAPKKSPRL